MVVLGIETSCDETAVAVLVDGATLSSVVSSHWLHGRYGGVVPELASRAHLQLLPMMAAQVFESTRLDLKDIDAVAVTRGPGLIGSLLVGISFAKSIAFACGKPIIGVNHLEGHLWSLKLKHPEVEPPFLSLLVSGGHTLLIGVDGFGRYRWIGGTRDDAAGEAFDKVAVLCGLGYPGGAEVEKRAAKGDPGFHPFPVGMHGQTGYDFSFSGLKTAVANFIRRQPDVLNSHREDLLASFQQAAITSLLEPTMRAMDNFGYRILALSGGVAANAGLRRRLEEDVRRRGGRFIYPGLDLCTDNAAMIAWVGWRRLLNGERDGYGMSGEANLPVAEIAEQVMIR